MLVTLTNDFHNRETRCRVGTMTAGNARRIRERLCGSDDCCCADNDLRTRGRQPERLIIEGRPDGTVTVERDD